MTHADLTGLSGYPWNEIVVDGRGNAYVNNIGFDFAGGFADIFDEMFGDLMGGKRGQAQGRGAGAHEDVVRKLTHHLSERQRVRGRHAGCSVRLIGCGARIHVSGACLVATNPLVERSS